MKNKGFKLLKKKLPFLFSGNYLLFLILVLGLIYRVWGLGENYSFWTDESHLAIFVRAILERGRPVLSNNYSTGAYQWLVYWFTAIFVKIFGFRQFSFRLPSVLFGLLTIWAVYRLGHRLFGQKVALLSAGLIALLRIEILWSRQARPYQALQFFFVFGLYCLYQYLEDKEIKYFYRFLTIAIVAGFCHGLGILLAIYGFIYLILVRKQGLRTWLLIFLTLVLLFLPNFKNIWSFTVSNWLKINNFSYYRHFLANNYLALTLFAFLGGLILAIKKDFKKLLLFIILIGGQLALVSFFTGKYLRYFYIIFPLPILLSTYAFIYFFKYLAKFKGVFKYPFLLIFSIIYFLPLLEQGKVRLWPTKAYSLNEDMQEVPEVNWETVYSQAGSLLAKHQQAVLIDSWNDLSIWYLGEDSLDYFIIKSWEGLEPFSGAEIINNLKQFEDIVVNQEKGVLVLDSWSNQVPEEIREYAHKNLKKELEIDRLYKVQPRYWTVWVYSWGLE